MAALVGPRKALNNRGTSCARAAARHLRVAGWRRFGAGAAAQQPGSPARGARSPAHAGVARSASSRLANPSNRHSRVRFLANPRYRTCA